MKRTSYETVYLVYSLKRKSYLASAKYDTYTSNPDYALSLDVDEAKKLIQSFDKPEEYVIVQCNKTIVQDITCKVKNYSFEDLNKCIQFLNKTEGQDKGINLLRFIPFLNNKTRPLVRPYVHDN